MSLPTRDERVAAARRLLDDIEDLCAERGFVLGHEDSEGGFLLAPRRMHQNGDYAGWLGEAVYVEDLRTGSDRVALRDLGRRER